MSGEAIRSIKNTEEEATKIVIDAQAESKRIIQKAREQKHEHINTKDTALKKEEESIKKSYGDKTQEVLKKLEVEEEKNIKKVDERCQKNLKKVVSYISKQIVKE